MITLHFADFTTKAAESGETMMRCVFCKSDTRDSVSIEHIMPESLGNVEHTLPRGWVGSAPPDRSR